MLCFFCDCILIAAALPFRALLLNGYCAYAACDRPICAGLPFIFASFTCSIIYADFATCLLPDVACCCCSLLLMISLWWRLPTLLSLPLLPACLLHAGLMLPLQATRVCTCAFPTVKPDLVLLGSSWHEDTFRTRGSCYFMRMFLMPLII